MICVSVESMCGYGACMYGMVCVYSMSSVYAWCVRCIWYIWYVVWYPEVGGGLGFLFSQSYFHNLFIPNTLYNVASA